VNTRTLIVASRSGESHQGGWSPVGRLIHDGQVYRFAYTQGARTAKDFHPFPGMDDLTAVYESTELFPLFANRMLPKSRPEYAAFLRWNGFDVAQPPDPIAILGVSEGIRQTDQIEVFPCPRPEVDGSYLNKFFAHGLRYAGEASRQRVDLLQPGERLSVMLDVGNQADPQAVALRTAEGDRVLLGYVPRYLAADVWTLLRECSPEFVTVIVERVNRDAPMQQRLLCRMQACWPAGFTPCSGEAFQAISAEVPATCVG
jgi:hypothetical protein